jgi:hypothetical protein
MILVRRFLGVLEAPREGLELVPLPNEVAVVVVLRRRGEAVAWDFFLVQSVVRVEEIVRDDSAVLGVLFLGTLFRSLGPLVLLSL